MAKTSLLEILETVNRPSVADAVFGELHRQILSLALLPGAKKSEVDVARALNLWRQPVRRAFCRLSRILSQTKRIHAKFSQYIENGFNNA